MRIRHTGQLATYFISTILLLFFNSNIYGKETEDEINTVLKKADYFFQTMNEAVKFEASPEVKANKFLETWQMLTDKSRKTIIDDIYKEERKFPSKEKFTREMVENDFIECRNMCVNYWVNFIFNFEPEKALNESQWNIGFIKNKEAEILLTNKNSQLPAKLKMFKESGVWKVGLVESFWQRK